MEPPKSRTLSGSNHCFCAVHVFGMPLAAMLGLGMKSALRDTHTEMFIKADGGETEFFEQAQGFDNYQQAFAFCKEKQLKRVEFVVRTAENYEFTVPLLEDTPPQEN